MSPVEIPESLRSALGPEMKMDVHWVDVRLKDGRSFRNLVVRGGRYITGAADAPNGESPLAFVSSDLVSLRRHSVLPSPVLWGVIVAITGVLLALAFMLAGM